MKLHDVFRRKNYDLPSVTDFDSTLKAEKSLNDSSSSLATESTTDGGDNTESNCITKDDKIADWKLPSFDAETTNGQTMEKELERLIVLRSFSLLDTGREEHFDRLVQWPRRFFTFPLH
jgi:hypothetical protein